MLTIKKKRDFINFTSSVLIVLSKVPFASAKSPTTNLINPDPKLVKNTRYLVFINWFSIAVQKTSLIPLFSVYLVAEWSKMCENNSRSIGISKQVGRIQNY